MPDSSMVYENSGFAVAHEVLHGLYDNQRCWTNDTVSSIIMIMW